MNNIQWYPGHMNKAKNEIEEKLRLVDIVFVLLDSRIPYSSLNPMLDKILQNKPKLFLLTKMDMADNNITNIWVKKFKEKNITSLPIDSISGANIKKIEVLSKEILKDKIAKDKAKGMKERSIRAMIVGIPNVGKSTLINKLVNKKVATVGNKPGVTTHQQWIRINDNFDLLDTPGVLWPKFDDKIVGINLALTGAIKDEVLSKDDLTLYLIDFLRNHYPHSFNRYNINNNDLINLTNMEVLDEVLKYSGSKKEDYDRAYEIILNDFKNGRLGKISLDLNYE